MRHLSNYAHNASGMSKRVKSKHMLCKPQFLDILRWFYASVDARTKTEMSWVDTFSWFLTVTFHCCHLLWHFHCREADVHIFGWIGLMLVIQLCFHTSVCPYNCVSIPLCVHTIVPGWAIVSGSSRTMTLESIQLCLSGVSIQHQCQSVLTGFNDTQQIQTKTLSSKF